MKFSADFGERIHNAGLTLLETVGVRIDHQEVYSEVLKAGARPGNGAGTLKFPKALVKEKLALAPSVARYSDLDFNITELKYGSPATFWTGAALNIRKGRNVRPFNSKDLSDLSRVIGSLEHVFAITGTSISDRNPATRDFAGFRIMAENTKKHLRPLMFSKRGIEPILEMAQVILNGKTLADYPVFSLGYSILSPFHWVEIPLNMWYKSRGHKIPVMINGEPIAGVSSPMTLAGSVAQSNAEIISGIVINQILEPGRPCIYNLGFAHAMDMKTTLCLSGSPECALMAAAGGVMAGHYNLPSASWMSTDALFGNYQAAAERMFNGLIHALHGVNVVWGIGQLESQKSISLEQCVLDNDLAGYIRHFQRGFEFSDNTIALDEIVRQGFEGKHLESDLTLETFRDVLYMPDIFARRYDNADLPVEKKDSDLLAEQRVEQILSSPTKPLLTDSQSKEMEAIEKRWEKALC